MTHALSAPPMAATPLDLTHAGTSFVAFTAAELRRRGVPAALVAAALAAHAVARASAHADAMRAALAPAAAGKLAEWQLKERLAAALAAGDPGEPGEVALLSAEAAARGLTLTGLVSLIGARAAALRQATLHVAVWEARTRAALAAAQGEEALDAALAAAAQAADALLAGAGA